MVVVRLPRSSARSARRLDASGRFCGGHYQVNLELDQVRPCRHPDLEESWVLALHELIAAPQVLGDPAAHIPESLRAEPAFRTKPRIDGSRIAVFEVLDDHVQHARAPRKGPASASRSLEDSARTRRSRRDSRPHTQRPEDL